MASNAQMLFSLQAEQQKKATENLKLAMQQDAKTQQQLKLELAELKKIKVDSVLAKALAAEFDVPVADIELLLRRNENDSDKVVTLLIDTPL